MSSTSYRLQPAPPVRALFTAAILFVIGAVLLVSAAANTWHWIVIVLAAIVMVLGIALMAAAAVATFRFRVHATLDATGYHIVSARGEIDGTWLDVTRVTLTGPRLVIERRDGGDHEVLTPRGDKDPLADKMMADMSHRLATRLG